MSFTPPSIESFLLEGRPALTAIASASKLRTLEELKASLAEEKARGRRVVFANGCFDLLHVGHVRYLEAARALGDTLVLALNSDRSVESIKGPGRPIQNQDERVEIVSSLACVDHVVLFDSPTVDALLRELRPDVHAKGTDYTTATVPERETVASYGGSVAIAGDPKDHSTRDLIRTILSRFAR